MALGTPAGFPGPARLCYALELRRLLSAGILTGASARSSQPLLQAHPSRLGICVFGAPS